MLDQMEDRVFVLKHDIGAATKLVARGKSTSVKTRIARISADVWSIAKDLSSLGSRMNHSQIDGVSAMGSVLSHYDIAQSYLEHDRREALAAYARAADELLTVISTWRTILGDADVQRQA